MKKNKWISFFLCILIMPVFSTNIYAQANPPSSGINGTTNDGVNSTSSSSGSGSGSSSGSTSSSGSSSGSTNGKNKGAQNFNGGNGAPIDGGVFILILATSAYTSSKIIKMNDKKKSQIV